jgi:hypothetical protein
MSHLCAGTRAPAPTTNPPLVPARKRVVRHRRDVVLCVVGEAVVLIGCARTHA